MPSIINSLPASNYGVQVYNSALNIPGSSPGRGATLAHTNGNVYCIFGIEGILYAAYSTDKGLTWSVPNQLTSGNWDDDPALIQLDTTSTSSDMGLVFNRDVANLNSGYGTTQLAYRCTMTTSCILSSAIDPVSNGTVTLSTGFFGFKYLSINQLSSGLYIISGLQPGSYPAIWYNATSFLTNSWVLYHQFTNTEIPYFPVSFSLKKLTNGDFAAVYAARTSLNGGWSGSPEGTVSTDIYFSSSLAANNAQVWNAPQNITSYPGSPTFDLVGYNQGIDADFTQFNDGSISVAYAEGYGSQVSSTITTPALPGAIGAIRVVAYHTHSNCLLLGGVTTGFFTFNLSTGTVNRWYTGSTNPIWSNNIKWVLVSTAGSFIAVITDSSLEIFSTGGNTDPSTWTLTSLRTTTSPACLGVPAYGVFKDDATLVVGWVSSSVSGAAVSTIDCSNISLGFTNLITPLVSACDSIRGSVYCSGNIVHFSSAPYFFEYNLSNNTYYYTNCGLFALADACYDDVNNQWLFISQQNGNITVISDSGSTITYSVASQALTGTNPTFVVPIPGNGALFYYQIANHGPGGTSVAGSTGIGYYSFITKTWYPSFQGQLEGFYQRQFFDLGSLSGIVPYHMIYSNAWLLFITGINQNIIRAINTNYVGRMKLGNGTYSAGVLTLSTFYDMVNQFKLGTQGNKLLFPRITATSDNTIIMAANELAYNYGARPLMFVIGTVAPNSQTIGIRCVIKKKATQQLAIRSWLSARTLRTITCKARINHEACIKIQARIIPRQAKTILIQAAIKNRKTGYIPCTFNVSQTISNIGFYGNFFIINGAQSGHSISSRVYISRPVRKKIFCHFTIPASLATGVTDTISINATARGGQVLGAKCYIS